MGAESNSYTRIVIGESSKMWAEWSLGLTDPWISRGWSISPEVGRQFGSRVAELGVWASAPFQGALSFLAKREGRLGTGKGADRFSSIYSWDLGVMWPWVLGWPTAWCLPANHRAAGPRVLHIRRCPNVNPQGCPGLWPDLHIPS